MLSLGGLSELLIIAIAAIILIGPKEIPVVLRTCGRWVQRIRNVTSHVREQVDHYIHQGEFEEYRRQVNESIASRQNEPVPSAHHQRPEVPGESHDQRSVS